MKIITKIEYFYLPSNFKCMTCRKNSAGIDDFFVSHLASNDTLM